MPRSRADCRPATDPASASRRDFLVGGALLSASLAVAAVGRATTGGQAAGRGPPLDRLVPDQVGAWSRASFANLLIPRAEKAEEKSYDEVLTRFYASPSWPPVVLLIAFSKAQSGGTELHRPEACYPVAGFDLERHPDVLLPLAGVEVAARSLTATASDRTEQLLYWTRVGNEFPLSLVAQRWSAARQSLRGAVPDGVLVRMSAFSPDRDPARAVLHRFATALIGGGAPALRSLLVGHPGTS